MKCRPWQHRLRRRHIPGVNDVTQTDITPVWHRQPARHPALPEPKSAIGRSRADFRMNFPPGGPQKFTRYSNSVTCPCSTLHAPAFAPTRLCRTRTGYTPGGRMTKSVVEVLNDHNSLPTTTWIIDRRCAFRPVKRTATAPLVLTSTPASTARSAAGSEFQKRREGACGCRFLMALRSALPPR
jgi:hypothetical protein